MSEPARNGTNGYEPPAPGWEDLRRGAGRTLLALAAAADAVLAAPDAAALARLDAASGRLAGMTAQIRRAIDAYEVMLAEEAAMRPGGCSRCAGCPRCGAHLTVLPGGRDRLGQPH